MGKAPLNGEITKIYFLFIYFFELSYSEHQVAQDSHLLFVFLLQVGGVVALCAHSSLLGHCDQMFVLCQGFQRPVCLLFAAAAIQKGPGQCYQPGSEKGSVFVVRPQHEQHVGHHR